MPDRRVTRPLVALSAAVLLMSPCLSAAADTPTPSEIAAAKRKVAAARQHVASLQEQAERAAEAYNGSLVRALKAKAAERLATRKAAQAQTTWAHAHDASTAAQSAADAATRSAEAADLAVLAAQQVADDAQLALDRMAAGAFTTGGQLGMAAQLFKSKDPLELANGRNLMNQVSAYQQQVVEDLDAAQQLAKTAADKATSAKTTALKASQHAEAVLVTASTAKADAEASKRAARNAALNTKHRLDQAMNARHRATLLVAKAEAALGSAVQRAKNLERAAAEARAQATSVHSGKAPSDAAATAIHWAFEEIGVPYSWGGGDANGPTYGFAQGAGTKGFDCSGLTLFAYAQAGVRLDHYTGSQWDQGKRINSRSDLLPGDLMFFAYDTSNPDTIHHVSLYIGNGKMIHAPETGDVVKVSPYGRGDFIGGTRPWQT